MKRKQILDEIIRLAKTHNDEDFGLNAKRYLRDIEIVTDEEIGW